MNNEWFPTQYMTPEEIVWDIPGESYGLDFARDLGIRILEDAIKTLPSSRVIHPLPGKKNKKPLFQTKESQQDDKGNREEGRPF